MTDGQAYIARMVTAGIQKSTNSETMNAVVEFKYDGDKKITGYFALTPKAIDYTVEKLFNAGFRGKSLSQIGDPNRWIAKDCEIVVKDEEYNGKVYTKIAYVNEPDSNKFAFIEPSKVHADLAHLDSALAAIAKKRNLKLDHAEDDFSDAAI
jgi:hypothetical protein